MGFANRAIVAAGLGFAVSALVGCGASGSLLSAEQASRLRNELAQASHALANDQCSAAQNAISSFSDSVDSLGSVNQTLVSNLEQGASTIQQLAATDCPIGSQIRTTPIKTTTRTTKPKTHTTQTNTLTDTISTSTYTYTPPVDTDTDTDTTQTETDTTTTQTDTDTTTTATTTTATTTTNTVTTPSGGTGLGGTTTTTDTTAPPPSGGVGPS